MVTLAIPTDAPKVYGPPQGQWTLVDYEQLDHSLYRYEVIDGCIYVSDVPSVFHQWIVGALFRWFGFPAQDAKQGYASSYVCVLMAECDPVRPDFLFVRSSRAEIINNRYVRGAPDLIVEVLSPNTETYEGEIKIEAYAHAGALEYAIVDPLARQVRLYTLNDEGEYDDPHVFDESDELSFACLPGISAPVHALFDGAPDTTTS